MGRWIISLSLLSLFLVPAASAKSLAKKHKTAPTIIVSPASSTSEEPSSKTKAGKRGIKKVADALNEYLSKLGPEEEWNAVIAEYGPVYGNYCGAGHGDPNFEQPCLSQLDCLCKEHDFGYSLRRYREADEVFVQQVFAAPMMGGKKNAEYEDFIRVMAATLFAGRVSGANLYDQVMDAYGDYEKNPAQARESLDKLINENEVFKKKIADIREERKKFEDIQAKLPMPKSSRDMSVAVQPFSAFLGVVALNFEKKLETWVSLRTGLSFLGSGLASRTYLDYGNSWEFSAFASVGPKLFIAGQALRNGVYVEPRVDIGYENVMTRTPPVERVNGLAIVPAFLVGFDKVFASGIHVDLGVGAGFHFPVPFSPVPANFSTFFVVPRFQASIGWAW